MYREANRAGCGPAHGRGGFGFHGKHRHHGFGGPWEPFRRPKYNVPVNIIETDAAYEISVYATGFDKADIKITVANDLLYINGSRNMDENHQPNFTRQEFPIKSFERILALNGQIDTTGITARQENAVLLILLPKTVQAQQPEQKIEVL